MSLKSLDPRVTRLHIPDEQPPMQPLAPLDQFQTFEAFHQKKDGAAYSYVGPVHAPNADAAFLFAKEQYSRRAACTGLWIIPTDAIKVTPYTENNQSVYEIIRAEEPAEKSADAEAYEIFHLKKRGKAHAHVGTVMATSYQEALAEAKKAFADKGVALNVWIVKAADVLRSSEEDKDIWSTTKDKIYREATAYRVMDKIEKFKQEQKQTHA